MRQKQVSQQRLSPARPFRRFELRGPLRSERLYYFVRSCGGPVSVRASAKYVSAGHPHQPSPIQASVTGCGKESDGLGRRGRQAGLVSCEVCMTTVNGLLGLLEEHFWPLMLIFHGINKLQSFPNDQIM